MLRSRRKGTILDLTSYTPTHRRELEHLLSSPAWGHAIQSGRVEETKAERIEPHETRNFIDTVMDQLLAFNEAAVKQRIEDGETDEERLVTELSRWPEDLEGRDPILSFLGLNVTPDCNFRPKCIYCNQPWVEPEVDLDGWKRIIAEVTDGLGDKGVYIYVTGGEPLLLGEQIWGDDGLVRFATERGAGVNVNTNATMITPEVALRFIKAGLAKLHISLDTHDRDLQNVLAGGERFDRILEGIYNVQLARDLVGVSYPVIHTNCVLTNRNLDHFPDLFALVLEKHKRVEDRSDPLFYDLFTHIIPIGGDGNARLRPNAEEFRRFYEQVWETVSSIWDEYQAQLGIPEDKRGPLFGYFSSPFLRVQHEGGLDAYVETAAAGAYGRLALSKQCYVAPTQAAFTPDGSQYRCGAHAVGHHLPIGNASETGVFDAIRSAIASEELPQEQYCTGCALATLYINQAVETKLGEKVKALIEEINEAGD